MSKNFVYLINQTPENKMLTFLISFLYTVIQSVYENVFNELKSYTCL